MEAQRPRLIGSPQELREVVDELVNALQVVTLLARELERELCETGWTIASAELAKAAERTTAAALRLRSWASDQDIDQARRR